MPYFLDYNYNYWNKLNTLATLYYCENFWAFKFIWCNLLLISKERLFLLKIDKDDILYVKDSFDENEEY